MWTVLYIAPSQSVALRIKEFMETEGILVRLRPLGFQDNSGNIEIQVTEAEIEEAQEVLNQALQVRQYRELRTK